MGHFFTEKDFQYMQKAIGVATKGIERGQTPFGACIVLRQEVLSVTHNVVWHTTDITAHAEVHAIRLACQKMGSIDLRGSVIYSTCEPCPMCFSACHWANIKKVIFGASIRDALQAGFREMTISNKRMKSLSGTQMQCLGGCLKKENQALFQLWLQRNPKVY